MTAASSDFLLSICIVNWNTRDLLKDCLDSIYADPQADTWEVLVVDNASSDDSVALVERHFPQVDLIVSAQNLGFSGGNNLALQKSRGALLLTAQYRYASRAGRPGRPGRFHGGASPGRRGRPQAAQCGRFPTTFLRYSAEFVDPYHR
jgi:GT2 family glycosyltransferase